MSYAPAYHTESERRDSSADVDDTCPYQRRAFGHADADADSVSHAQAVSTADLASNPRTYATANYPSDDATADDDRTHDETVAGPDGRALFFAHGVTVSGTETCTDDTSNGATFGAANVSPIGATDAEPVNSDADGDPLLGPDIVSERVTYPTANGFSDVASDPHANVETIGAAHYCAAIRRADAFADHSSSLARAEQGSITRADARAVATALYGEAFPVADQRSSAGADRRAVAAALYVEAVARTD